MQRKKKRIGILISGSGTNMMAIIKAILAGLVDAIPVFVGADNDDARAPKSEEYPDGKGLTFAENMGIDNFVVDFPGFRATAKQDLEVIDPLSDDELREIAGRTLWLKNLFRGNDEKIMNHLRWKTAAERELIRKIGPYQIDLLVMAGYMQLCTSYFLDAFNQGAMDLRVMNIHPALLPSFPGTDGYGDTFYNGNKVGGSTVHFADFGEDSGPIIGQKPVMVLPDDTKESFQQRGLRAEYKLYPRCIQLFCQDRLKVVWNDDPRKNGIKRKIVKILPKEE